MGSSARQLRVHQQSANTNSTLNQKLCSQCANSFAIVIIDSRLLTSSSFYNFGAERWAARSPFCKTWIFVAFSSSKQHQRALNAPDWSLTHRVHIRIIFVRYYPKTCPPFTSIIIDNAIETWRSYRRNGRVGTERPANCRENALNSSCEMLQWREINGGMEWHELFGSARREHVIFSWKSPTSRGNAWTFSLGA